MSKALKKIKNPAAFVAGNGLLFEINRHILHPFGLAMETDGDDKFSIVDYRQGERHAFYEAVDFEDGLQKANEFLKNEGMKQARARKETLGFSIQTVPDPHMHKNGVLLPAALPEGDIHYRVSLDWLQQKALDWHGMSVEMFLMDLDVEQSTNLYREAQKESAFLSEAPESGPVQ